MKKWWKKNDKSVNLIFQEDELGRKVINRYLQEKEIEKFYLILRHDFIFIVKFYLI